MNSIGSWVFYVDEGAVYDVSFYGDGIGVITGRRTRVMYTSPDHNLKITGTYRWQPVGPGPQRHRLNGHRAVLTLDTGEGLSELRGVVHPSH